MSVKRKIKREKGLKFAKGLNILDFIASEGWLNRRKKGAGLLFGLVNRGPTLLILLQRGSKHIFQIFFLIMS